MHNSLIHNTWYYVVKEFLHLDWSFNR